MKQYSRAWQIRLAAEIEHVCEALRASYAPPITSFGKHRAISRTDFNVLEAAQDEARAIDRDDALLQAAVRAAHPPQAPHDETLVIAGIHGNAVLFHSCHYRTATT